MEGLYCIFCTEEVTSRQGALLYVGCDRWQHRRCKTGISREQYRAAVRSGDEIIWRCLFCNDEDVPISETDLNRLLWHSSITVGWLNLSKSGNGYVYVLSFLIITLKWLFVSAPLYNILVLSNELIKVELPRWKIRKADILSVSPLSEQNF